MYRPVLITPPAILPVTREEAKANARIDGDDEDALIDHLIAAATAHYDGWTGVLGRCLVEQTWRQDYDRFARCLRLPLAPVIAVTQVTYRDPDEIEQTMDSDGYALLEDERGAYIRFHDDIAFPAVRDEGPAVSVVYTAGYANTADTPPRSTVPAPIRHAILMAVSHWYANREAVATGVTVGELPFGCDALTAPFRRRL